MAGLERNIEQVAKWLHERGRRGWGSVREFDEKAA
jgi:hypothetical protein